MCVCVCVCVHAQSLRHVQLSAVLQTVAHQAPLSMEFYRQESWSGFPSPPLGDLPDPGVKPVSLPSPALGGRFFTPSTSWEVHSLSMCIPERPTLKSSNPGHWWILLTQKARIPSTDLAETKKKKNRQSESEKPNRDDKPLLVWKAISVFNDLLRRVITHTVSRRHPQIISSPLLIETGLTPNTVLFQCLISHFPLQQRCRLQLTLQGAVWQLALALTSL